LFSTGEGAGVGFSSAIESGLAKVAPQTGQLSGVALVWPQMGQVGTPEPLFVYGEGTGATLQGQETGTGM
jgi:hypothetical protein